MGSVPWGGPAWAELDVTQDCTAFGAYAAWVTTDDNEPPFPTVASFWRAVVPEVNSTQPNNAQIIDWHEWVRLNRTTLARQVADISSCRPELCQAIGSEIDGGLAGFGVSTSHLPLGTEVGFVGRLPLEFKVIRSEKALHRQEGDSFLDEAEVHGGNGA
ncbi:hypothetical protein N0V92_009879 [Colletotrichum tropicale]|nr:hypothetical protein N0V92_009879 [Colletotrichum tropicale]